MNYELLIGHGDAIYMPSVEDGIQWVTERKGAPSKLTFKVISDEILQLEEGDAVRFRIDEQDVFYGFIFALKRNQTNEVQVTAYDQLRYLKNKDTYVYEGKKASEVIQMIAADFSLNVGTLDPTSYVIPSRVEENTTLFDIIQNALDLELQFANEMYVLYDDFGKLTLKNIGNMQVNILLDAETGESYDYQTTIDSNTYNQIKVVKNDSETGTREVWMARSSENINKWGILQYTESLDDGENGQVKADALLKLYNEKTRTLKVNNAFGDLRVRAGTLVGVYLNLGEAVINNFMLVEKATHTFKRDQYQMSLTLRGGIINGQQ